MKEIAFCICTGKSYVTTLTASGEEAAVWLAAFEAQGEPHREDARRLVTAIISSTNTPCGRLALTLRSSPGRAEVIARLDDRELVLSNARGPSLGDKTWLRTATVTETFILAARWLLAMGRLGCCDPLEDAFWFRRATFAAYVVRPRIAGMGRLVSRTFPWLGAFVAAVEGTEDGALRTGVLEGFQEWSARHPESHAAFGWFTGSAPAAVYQIAVAVEGVDAVQEGPAR